jgi:hypothetical protein
MASEVPGTFAPRFDHGRPRRQPTALVNGFYLADEDVFLGYRLVPGPNGGVLFHMQKERIKYKSFTDLFLCLASSLVVEVPSSYTVSLYSVPDERK